MYSVDNLKIAIDVVKNEWDKAIIIAKTHEESYKLLIAEQKRREA